MFNMDSRESQKASGKLQKAMEGLKYVRLTPRQVRKFDVLRACERV